MHPSLAAAYLSLCVSSLALAQTAPTAELVTRNYLKASNNDVGDMFGWGVAISGDTIAVAALGEDGGVGGVDTAPHDNSKPASGAVYVFVRDGDAFVQQAYLKASNPDEIDQFGLSLALDGDTLVVGAKLESSAAQTVNGDQSDNSAFAAGAAYVFVRDGGTWTQQAYLKGSNTEAGDEFGYSVSVSGDTVAVAAIGEDSAAVGIDGDGSNNFAPGSGAAYVFVRNGTTWTQQAYIKAHNAGAEDQFGSATSLSGDTLVVGSRYEDGDAHGVNGPDSNVAQQSGAAYVFVREGTTWSQQAYLKAGNCGIGDALGFSVGISGDTLVVGALGEDSSAVGVDGDGHDDAAAGAGAAYVFEREGTTWTQTAYLKASNTDGQDSFSRRVGVSGDVIVVGAHGEASLSNVFGGNETDNSGPFTGAAYVYVRDCGRWEQRAYLKADNAGPDDYFGWWVGVSGETVISGAFLEDGSAAQVNGDGGDDGAWGSGAVYAYDLDLSLDGYVVEESGCEGELAPACIGPISAANGFAIVCPEMSRPCATPTVLFFGECSPSPIELPAGLGCGTCSRIAAPILGAVQAPLVVGPGLLIGFEFCVHCGCQADLGGGGLPCVNLSPGRRVVVGP